MERTCKCCAHLFDSPLVENEYHFLLVCPIYGHERKALLDVVRSKFNLTQNDILVKIHDINDLFVRIMESDDRDIINQTATYLERAFFKRERLLLAKKY